jgi:hypothetical protein
MECCDAIELGIGDAGEAVIPALAHAPATRICSMPGVGPSFRLLQMSAAIDRLAVQRPIDDPGFELLDSLTPRTSDSKAQPNAVL